MPSTIFAAPAGVIERAPASEISETTDGFVVVVTPQAARRQLHVSLGLMGVMAAGVALLIAANGMPAQTISSPPAHRASLSQPVSQPTFVRALTAARSSNTQEADQQRHRYRNAPRG